MSADPENADRPDTAEDLAWEARHCADRLDEIADLVPINAFGPLIGAAKLARQAAERLERDWSRS